MNNTICMFIAPFTFKQKWRQLGRKWVVRSVEIIKVVAVIIPTHQHKHFSCFPSHCRNMSVFWLLVSNLFSCQGLSKAQIVLPPCRFPMLIFLNSMKRVSHKICNFSLMDFENINYLIFLKILRENTDENLLFPQELLWKKIKQIL